MNKKSKNLKNKENFEKISKKEDASEVSNIYGFIRKILKTIGVPIIWIFVGMIIGSVYQDQINNFTDEIIKGKSDHLSIGLTHQVIFKNNELIDFRVFSDKNITLTSTDMIRNYSLNINERKNDYSLYEDNNKIITEGVNPLQYNFIHKNGTITPICGLFFIKKFALKPNETRSYSLMYDLNLTLNTDIFSVVNSGNKIVKSFKAGICLRNAGDLSTSGDIIDRKNGCLEIRSTNLLPTDELKGFFQADKKYEIENVYGWDEQTGDYPQNRFVESILVIIPNCYAT